MGTDILVQEELGKFLYTTTGMEWEWEYGHGNTVMGMAMGGNGFNGIEKVIPTHLYSSLISSILYHMID